MKKIFTSIILSLLLLSGSSFYSSAHAANTAPPLWQPAAVNLVIYQKLFNYIAGTFTGITTNIPIPCSNCGSGSCTSYINPTTLQLTIPPEYNSSLNLNISWQGSTQSLLLKINEIHGYIAQADGKAEEKILFCIGCDITIKNLNVDVNDITFNIKPLIIGHYLKLQTVGQPSMTINNVTIGSISSSNLACAIAGDFYTLIQPIIQPIVDSIITGFVNNQLMSKINDMLSKVSIDLYIHGRFPPIAYQVRPSLFYQALHITDNAAKINLDAGIGTAPNSAGQPSLPFAGQGSIKLPVSVGAANCPPLPLAPPPQMSILTPSIDTSGTDAMLGFGVAQGIINEALYAVYQSGMMCISTPPLPVALLKSIIPELPNTGSLVLSIIPTQAPVIKFGSLQDPWNIVQLNGLIIIGKLGVDEAQNYPDANAAYNTRYTNAFVLSTDLSIRAEVYIDRNKLDANGNPMLVVKIDTSPQGMRISDTVLASELTNPSNVDKVIKLGMSLATGFIGSALPAMSSAFTFSGVTILVKDIIPSGGYMNVYLDITGFMNLLPAFSPPQPEILVYNNPSTGALRTLALSGNTEPLLNTNSNITFKLDTPVLPAHAKISWRLSDQSVFGAVWQGWSIWTTNTTINTGTVMDGVHTLEVRAENSETGIVSQGTYTTFKVDTVPPELKLANAQYPDFTFNVSDAVTKPRIIYAVDSTSKYKLLNYGENTITLNNIPAGNHTLFVRAVDQAGNMTPVRSIPFTITQKTTGGCGTVPFENNIPIAGFLFILLPIGLLLIRRARTHRQ